ncbi:MAG: GntR family transcriptional regulator [Bauldia sp.]|uniref:GntR family transcriptional regulator n=1 Tax=Bauldia sp. TaxID=2575872 RepID=UPI001D3590C3|nr:GntR family transcriptional regulator [Bauldia sp.]MCB1497326.1 GntR family transcriptional regulator [Bauldia sp.]
MAQSTLFDRDIDRSSPQPFYLQLSDAIEAAIDSGLFTPGERLPSESELCRKFDLARSTVRETLRTLEDRRRIRVVPRRGAFVIDPWQAGWGLQVATGFFEGEVDANRRNVETEILEAEVKPFKGHCAKALDLAEGSPGFLLRRLRKLDGKEAVYSKNYLPIGMRDAVLAGDVLSGGSLNKSLGKAGHRIYSARRSVEAVAAAADVAKLLAVPVASPLLLVTSVSWGQNGQPIDYYNSWVRTDVVNVTVEASTGPK